MDLRKFPKDPAFSRSASISIVYTVTYAVQAVVTLTRWDQHGTFVFYAIVTDNDIEQMS